MIATRLRKFYQAAASRARVLLYRALGLRVAGRIRLEAIEWPLRPACISLADGVALDRGVTLLATDDAARITIGARCYLNRHTMLDASQRIEIGEDTMIGPFCYLTDHDHTFAPGTAPAAGPLVSAPTIIGPRCWLGARVTVLKGVTIGAGTVVGAGSIVTKSLPPGVLAVGSPARIIREIAG